jgi:hypothetical protein
MCLNHTVVSQQGRSFDNRIVDVKFYSEDAFRSQHYSLEPQAVIVTASYGATTKERIFTAGALNKMAPEADL